MILSLAIVVSFSSCSQEERDKLLNHNTAEQPVVCTALEDHEADALWHEQFEIDYANGDLSAYAITDVVYIGPCINPMSWGDSYGDYSKRNAWKPKDMYSYKINGHTVNKPVDITLDQCGAPKYTTFYMWVYEYEGSPRFINDDSSLSTVDGWVTSNQYGFSVYPDRLVFTTSSFYKSKDKYADHVCKPVVPYAAPDQKFCGFFYADNFWDEDTYFAFDPTNACINSATVKVTLTMKNISHVEWPEFWSGH